MFSRVTIIFLSVLLLFLSATLSHGTDPDCVDRVVAVVNDDVITLSELEKMGGQYFESIKAQAPPGEVDRALEKGRQEVLSSMVDNVIVRQKAVELDIKVEEAEIDEAIDSVIASNNITLEDFKRELSRANLSLQDYREGLRDQILQSKLINYEVRSRIVIVEKNMEEYYHTEYSQVKGESGYYILQMGFNWQNPGKLKVTGFDTKEEIREKAEEIRARVLAGESFAELAKSYSDVPSASAGGDIGLLKKDEMAPYMKDIIVPMYPGEISQIIDTNSTFQFFKLLSASEGDIIVKVPYESVRDEIQEKLYQQEMEKQYKLWLKSLREKAYIKILL